MPHRYAMESGEKKYFFVVNLNLMLKSIIVSMIKALKHFTIDLNLYFLKNKNSMCPYNIAIARLMMVILKVTGCV